MWIVALAILWRLRIVSGIPRNYPKFKASAVWFRWV